MRLSISSEASALPEGRGSRGSLAAIAAREKPDLWNRGWGSERLPARGRGNCLAGKTPDRLTNDPRHDF